MGIVLIAALLESLDSAMSSFFTAASSSATVGLEINDLQPWFFHKFHCPSRCKICFTDLPNFSP